MRFLLLLLIPLLPMAATASYVTGVDDIDEKRPLKISESEKKQLDENVLSYYQSPTPEKINAILDLMAETTMLERKTAWSPLTGFLTVVFASNKDKVMGWMSRNDYNTYAQYVIVNALMHAKLKESALLFAKAHKWGSEDLYQLRETDDQVNLKTLKVVIPGHIDTLWGAFFASGETDYLNTIIDSLFTESLPDYAKDMFFIPDGADTLAENKSLAARTLRDYAQELPLVREVLEKRYDAEPQDSPRKKLYKQILGK